MSARELANAVKGGSMSRRAAIERFRTEHSVSFIDAVLAVDIAIGDINEGL